MHSSPELVLQDTMDAKNLHAFKKRLEKFMGKSPSTTVKQKKMRLRKLLNCILVAAGRM